jgi:Cell wall-active antibiotics response 4TMS YvqF
MRDRNGRWAVGVFGDSTATGRWQPAARTRAVAIFGDSELDMRDTVGIGDEIIVRAVAGFGDVRVMVPPGSRVEMSGFALFGNKRNGVVGNGPADGPVVRVKACALFGDVKVA